jgi:type II secretory pathway predicted ATPase ExeA
VASAAGAACCAEERDVYESFYGLHARPFGKTPDPAFLFEGPRHGEALARLETAAADKDIALLTGDIGAGKTTLSRALIDRLASDKFRVVLVINPRLSALEMLAFIAERLGVDDAKITGKHKTKLIDALTARMFALYEEGISPIVIVDEAHLVTQKAVFEELRLLTNLQLDDAPLVGLLLIGQPELRDTLAKKSLASFTQRIGMAFHLTALDADETAAYVAHRLMVAGREEPLFTAGALAAIHRGSGGIPRRINTLCQAALLAGFAESATEIDEKLVEDVRKDFAEHLGALFAGSTREEVNADKASRRAQGAQGAPGVQRAQRAQRRAS